MNVFPKFIIETDEQKGDCLIISKCTYHHQLATDKTKVKGGGWWLLNKEEKIFTFYGESYDFGSAKLEDIIKCVDNKKIFRNKALTVNISNDFKFKYKDIYGEIYELN